MNGAQKLSSFFLTLISFSVAHAQQTLPPQLYSGPPNRPPQLYTGATNPPPALATIPTNSISTIPPVLINTPPPIATIPIPITTITNQVVGTIATNTVLLPGQTLPPTASTSGTPIPAQAELDSQLNQRITQAFQSHMVNVILPNIRISTTQGRVTVQGFVENGQMKSELITIAQNLAGTGNVIDQLTIQRNP